MPTRYDGKERLELGKTVEYRFLPRSQNRPNSCRLSNLGRDLQARRVGPSKKEDI